MKHSYNSAFDLITIARMRAKKFLKSDISEKVKALKKHNRKRG